MKSYKFKISPSKAVQTRFEQTLDLCCELYNGALQERRDAWKLNRISINYHIQRAQLPDIKLIRPEYDDVYSQVSQDVLRRLSKAFDNFFRRVKRGEKPGHPRFKARSRYDSFTYVQSGFKIVGDKLILSKIGSVRIKQHRPIEGTIKTCTIKRETNGWYVVFACETEDVPLNKNIYNPIAIDVGLTHFMTLSNGEKVGNPRFFKTDERALAKAGRRLSKEQKGSVRFKKRVRVLQKIHRRIKNRRNDFAHQESHKLVNRFDALFFEDLSIDKMMQNGFLAKGIADVAWNQLISFSSYKAANAGKVCKTVNPKGTSQRCSDCGNKVQKDLSVRVHHCTSCGLKICRDLNAALNILTLGLQSVGNQSLEAPSKPCLVGE